MGVAAGRSEPQAIALEPDYLSKNKLSSTSKTFLLGWFQIRLWINDNYQRL